jgi:hypothetical protein
MSVADFWCANIPVVLYEIARVAASERRSGLNPGLTLQILWIKFIGPPKLASQG